MRLLLRCPKTDVTARDWSGRTALEWAEGRGNADCARAIEEREKLLAVLAAVAKVLALRVALAHRVGIEFWKGKHITISVLLWKDFTL